MSRDHISPSAKLSYQQCGYRFFRRETEKVKRTSIPLGIGRAAHKVIQYAAKLLRAEQPVPQAPECADVAVATYDAAMAGADVTENKSEVESGRDLAAAGGVFLRQAVVPTIIQPDLIEASCLASYGTWQLRGIVDLSDKAKEPTPRIRDLKTGRRAKTPDFAHGSEQLTAYSILFQAAKGKAPDLQIDSVSYKKAGWSYVPLPTERTPEDIRGYWEAVQLAEAGIKAGIFPPAPEGSWYCSPSWCEFWADCPFVSARRRNTRSFTDE